MEDCHDEINLENHLHQSKVAWVSVFYRIGYIDAGNHNVIIQTLTLFFCRVRLTKGNQVDNFSSTLTAYLCH